MQPDMQSWLHTSSTNTGPAGHRLAKSQSVPVPNAVPMDTDSEQRKQAKQRYHQKAQKQYRCDEPCHDAPLLIWVRTSRGPRTVRQAVTP